MPWSWSCYGGIELGVGVHETIENGPSYAGEHRPGVGLLLAGCANFIVFVPFSLVFLLAMP